MYLYVSHTNPPLENLCVFFSVAMIAAKLGAVLLLFSGLEAEPNPAPVPAPDPAPYFYFTGPGASVDPYALAPPALVPQFMLAPPVNPPPFNPYPFSLQWRMGSISHDDLVKSFPDPPQFGSLSRLTSSESVNTHR